MRFAFYVEEWGKPFSLRQLKEGRPYLGGPAQKHRVLFWLAKRGHAIRILNHSETAELDGVSAVRVGTPEEIPAAVERLGGVDLFVFSFRPEAMPLIELPIPAARAKAMWTTNPVPLFWLDALDGARLHRMVCISRADRELYRIHPNFKRVEVSYLGVDLDLLEPAPDARSDNLVLFLGAPRVGKGFENLLAAWPHVRKAHPDARLRVLGSIHLHNPAIPAGWTGVLDAEFESKFLNPLLGPSRDPGKLGIEFAGLLPPQEVSRQLRQAAVAVVNCSWEKSLAESYCRSAVEAQVCGTPVVGAALGALPEVVLHNRTGLLVSEPSPLALAGAVGRLLADPALRRQFGEAARGQGRAVGNYEQICADWEGIGERALHNTPAPGSRSALRDALRVLGYGGLYSKASRIARAKKEGAA